MPPQPGFEIGEGEDKSDPNRPAEPSSTPVLDTIPFVLGIAVRDCDATTGLPSLLNTLLEGQDDNALGPMCPNQRREGLLDSTPLLGLSQPTQPQDINLMNLLNFLDNAVDQRRKKGEESQLKQEDNMIESLRPLSLGYRFRTFGIGSNPWAYEYELEQENT